MQRVEDSFDSDLVSDSEDLSISNVMLNEEKKNSALDIDLNEMADCGFDLNKFPNEDEEDEDHFVNKEFHQVVKIMLKIYLPKFY